MSSFPARCVQTAQGKRVVASEGKRKFILNNPGRLKVRKVRLDGCAIVYRDGRKSCDFGMWTPYENKTAYLIELKGKAVVHACRQILETLRYLREHHSEEIADREVFSVIVCSANTAPKLHVNPDYVRLFRATGRKPFIQSGQAQQTC